MRSFKQRVFLFLLAGVGSLCLAGPNPHVVLETNFGDITIELYPDDAPITVDNFLRYVNDGFYDGLLFHRVENRDQFGFGLDVIQGGACYFFEDEFYFPPTGDPIINESDNGLSNLRGTIAMARTSEPDSATAQFFINHQDNINLDRNSPTGDGFGYCVFGVVVEGLEIIDDIAAAPVVDLQSINPLWPPYTHFPNPIIGMYQANVLQCDVSYCGNLSDDIRIDFEDFALFASSWLDDCDSADSFCSGADLDYSGLVDMLDLELFSWHWAQSVGHEPKFSDLVVNNVIDLADLTALMDHWLETGCDQSNDYCEGGDINHTGNVDLTDYSLFSANWLGSY